MLVVDRKKISNVGMSPQFQPLGIQVKQSCVVEIVLESSNLSLSDREEAELFGGSDAKHTHYLEVEPREILC